MSVPRNFFRVVVLGIVGLFCNASPARGQQWVREMFADTEHDFGTVPQGSKAEFEFKLQNRYEEVVHIASVTSSCGCTKPSIKKADLKTYEQGSIVCEFNTKDFVGSRAAVVTVVFTKPNLGEMQLIVRGTIRSDIVVEPGSIAFGEIDGGEEKTTQVKVYYTGRKAWEITDVRSANQNLAVQLAAATTNGRQGYLMTVKLKDTAPAGDFTDQIVMVTNDPEFNYVTIPVSGSVMTPLRLPVSVELGSVQAGKNVSSSIIVSGRDEFEVTDVQCSDPRFTFARPSGKKKVHKIPLEFSSRDSSGAFQQTVTVKTTLPEGGTASTVVSGNVLNP